MTTRRTFFAASAVIAPAALALAPAAARGGATPDFDRAAFQARVRQPFAHRQAFASPRVADGAVLGFMRNSLEAYDHGFEDRPGTLHAAAILYSTGVALALDDAAWAELKLAERLNAQGDRVSWPEAARGNPFLRMPAERTIGELQRRNASFFVCANALNDLAQRSGTTSASLREHLLPGMMIVPAGVAAVNAMQEEHFTLFMALV